MFEGEVDMQISDPTSDINSIPQCEVGEISTERRCLETEGRITAQIRAERFRRFRGVHRPGIVERNVRRAERSAIK